MWNTLSTALHSKRQMVMNVRSNEVVVLVLPGGRTKHFKLKIPVPTLQSSICNIEKDSELTELLQLTNLIKWDEVL